MFSQSAEALADAARAAKGNGALAAGVEAIYRFVEAGIASRRPTCRQCSHCCRFDRFGHNLFVSTAELAYFLRRTDLSRIDGPIGGACPFLRMSPARCAARAARPLGCRLFYCDTSAQWWQQGVYSNLHRRMQVLHEAFQIPYFYGEWLGVLRASTMSQEA